MTATVLNTKISEVENKLPGGTGLVIMTVLNTKISEVKNNTPDPAKYTTITATQEFI